MKLLPLLILFFSLAPAKANIFNPGLWFADHKLQKQEYPEARKEYLKIQVHEPHNPRLNYNLGIAHYREKLYDQAISSFTRAAEESKSNKLKEHALYNLGNAFFQMENYRNAVTAYENALAIDINDEDAKHNLELARKKLKEQENNKKNDKNKDDKQKDKDKDKNDKGNKKDKKDQAKAKPQPNQLNQDDINRILKQVGEAGPGEVTQQRAQKSKAKTLKPW